MLRVDIERTEASGTALALCGSRTGVPAVPLFDGGVQVSEQRRGRCSTSSAGMFGCLVGADVDPDSVFLQPGTRGGQRGVWV